MKRIRKWCLIVLFAIIGQVRVQAQAQELEQLALDIEKLAQFKQILNDLKKGYDILWGGYSTIKNISQGNFNLHDAFLNSLLSVSPTVKRYKKIGDITNAQLQLIKEYKAAVKRFAASGSFSSAELDYIARVYHQLEKESLQNLDALLQAVTDGRLRMTDDERLSAIDGIYASMEDKLAFLRSFNNKTTMLGIQRAREQHSIGAVESLYGLQK